jgi:hypothetical protein
MSNTTIIIGQSNNHIKSEKLSKKSCISETGVSDDDDDG